MIDKIKILILAIVIAGCSDGLTEKQKLAAIEQNKAILAFTCEDNGSHSTPMGNLQNNILKADLATDFDWTQCLAMQTIDASTRYGWYWQWPEDGKKVYSQPQITLGNSPWLNHHQIKSGYPIPVKQLQKLDIDYSLEILSDGEFNLETTLWLSHLDTILLESDQSSIAAEILIWTYSSDDFHANPVGEEVAQININGIEWEVWLEKNRQDRYRTNDNTWVYLAFRSRQPLKQIKFDAAEMLRYGIEQKLITSDLYIADIQLGTNIMSGTGQVWLNNFQVDVVSTKQ